MEPQETERVPRRFTSAGLRGKPREDVPLVRVLDIFVLGSRHRTDQEWVVGLDALGELVARPLADAELMSGACKDLAHHGAVAGGTPRRLDFDAVHIMTVETVEHVQSEASLRHAVYLYGRMRGPIPETGGAGHGVDGMLAVSRAEILQALAWAANRCFQVAASDAGASARCAQLALPGEGANTLAQGRGLVLAYPLFPAEVSFDDPSNDMLVSHLAYDVLRSLQNELVRADSGARFVAETLPVPSRAEVISKLRAQGFSIDGDTAIKKNEADGVTGWLGNVFGVGVKKVLIPPEASVDVYLELAGQALELVAEWPSGASRIIAERTGVASAQRQLAPSVTTRKVAVAPPPRRDTPAWTNAFMREHRRGATSEVMSSSTLAAEREGWSGDFDAGARAARQPRAKPRRVRAKKAKKEGGAGAWSDDFGTASKPALASTEDPRPAAKDDWSDDFG